MRPIDNSRNASQTHNQAGCPYVNQTGGEAVQDWSRVLAIIDLVMLPAELQAELQLLRLKCAGADMPALAS